MAAKSLPSEFFYFGAGDIALILSRGKRFLDNLIILSEA